MVAHGWLARAGNVLLRLVLRRVVVRRLRHEAALGLRGHWVSAHRLLHVRWDGCWRRHRAPLWTVSLGVADGSRRTCGESWHGVVVGSRGCARHVHVASERVSPLLIGRDQ